MRETNWGVTALIVLLVVLLVASAAWNGFLYAKVGSVHDSVTQVREEVNAVRVDMRDMERRIDLHDTAPFANSGAPPRTSSSRKRARPPWSRYCAFWPASPAYCCSALNWYPKASHLRERRAPPLASR